MGPYFVEMARDLQGVSRNKSETAGRLELLPKPSIAAGSYLADYPEKTGTFRILGTPSYV
jgi:hypothetical protein